MSKTKTINLSYSNYDNYHNELLAKFEEQKKNRPSLLRITQKSLLGIGKGKSKTKKTSPKKSSPPKSKKLSELYIAGKKKTKKTKKSCGIW